jgi:hypothetical protein
VRCTRHPNERYADVQRFPALPEPRVRPAGQLLQSIVLGVDGVRRVQRGQQFVELVAEQRCAWHGRGSRRCHGPTVAYTALPRLVPAVQQSEDN